MKRYVITLSGKLVHEVVETFEITNIHHLVKQKKDVASKCNEVLGLRYDKIFVDYMPFGESECINFIVKFNNDDEAKLVFDKLCNKLSNDDKIFLYRSEVDRKSHTRYDSLMLCNL